MNGAKALLNTLLDSGIEVCFSNPGTSEMHFVAALDDSEGMRCVLGLFEGVVTGAADGYARIAGKPAATLLHLGPGLANGLANLHNAKKARVPLINIIGDHATYHIQYDSPLTSDVEAIAATNSHWVKTCRRPDNVARDAAEAIAAATKKPGQIASLILPADVSWQKTHHHSPAVARPCPLPRINEAAIDNVEQVLMSGEPVMLLMGGCLERETLALAGKIAATSGARLGCETFPSRLAHGAGTAAVEKVPYLAEFAIDQLKDLKHIILVGAVPPVSFFAYPLVPSELQAEGCHMHQLVGPDEDMMDALERLSAKLGKLAPANCHADTRPELPSGALNGTSIAQSIGALLPEQAIVVDEGLVGGLEVYSATANSPAHDWLIHTGGSIGWGLPVATGAAIAAPERKVVCLEGDGSAMYTIQALWTMAREKLDVTTVIFANREYAILQMEYMRVGAEDMGHNAKSQMDIGNPDLDFTAMATAMGVHATRATTAEAFNEQFNFAMNNPGPHLIEAVI